MDPLPETSEAIRRLDEYGETAIQGELRRLGEQSLAEVPQLVGLSLALLADRLTFTLVASSDLVARLDAVQYLDDGPCVEAIHSRAHVETDVDRLLDEDRWLLFARASATAGVASTLSLPVLGAGEVVAGVNLYASTPDAFVGHHDRLATICRAWAPGVVTNADLGFSSRLEAAATPGRMRDRSTVDQAVGMLAEAQHLDTAVAAERITRAATRAGISEAQAAETVIRILGA
jgi:hypothetical protein